MKLTSFFHTTNLFVRSLIFSLLASSILIVYSFICVACAPFLSLKYRYKIVISYTLLIIWLLKVICNIHYKVEGRENIPNDRTGIILSKHQSTWETFYIPSLFTDPAIILKQELLWVPFFGWGLATVDPIAINRSNTSSAMEQIINKGRKCLEAGRWILIFPEGTRIPVGQVGKYRLGGARLAVATGYPVIPIAHNAGLYWPRRKFIKQPGTVHMVIGPLIETKGRTAEEVMTETKNWIEDTIKKLN